MKTNVIALMGMLLSLSLTSCKPDDEVLIITELVQEQFVGEGFTGCDSTPVIRGSWTFDAGLGWTLRHTNGLRIMALRGDHGTLRAEFCGQPRRDLGIPAGLEDDPEGDGYASQYVYGNYIVAMYHPSTYPDHFITYNILNGKWTRWDLGANEDDPEPTVFRTNRTN